MLVNIASRCIDRNMITIVSIPAALISSTSASQTETGDRTRGAAAALEAVLLLRRAAANCGTNCKAAEDAIWRSARLGLASGAGQQLHGRCVVVGSTGRLASLSASTLRFNLPGALVYQLPLRWLVDGDWLVEGHRLLCKISNHEQLVASREVEAAYVGTSGSFKTNFWRGYS